MQEKRTKFSPIKERIIQLIDLQGITKKEFFEKTNISSSNFKGKGAESEIGADKLVKILSIYDFVNPEWLLTGKGNMLKCIPNFIDKSKLKSIPKSIPNCIPNQKKGETELKSTPKNTPNGTPNSKKDENTAVLSGDMVAMSLPDNFVPGANGLKPIPLVYHQAVAGFGGSSFSISEQDVKDYYVIPKFKHRKVDFMIEVYGNSMYPKYNSGDIVAATIINESNFIQWNKPHVIATVEQGILVKRILKGETPDSLLLKSDNKDYPPFEIPKSDITGIALIIGVIRLE